MFWLTESWERKDKFKGIEDDNVYFWDRNNEVIKKGKKWFFCGTVGLFHVYDESKKCYYVQWNDMEPLTDEGYNVLAERLKTMKETS